MSLDGDAAHFEHPHRIELFSVEQMEKHGRTLSESHAVSLKLTPDKLLDRLAANEATLIDACRTLNESTTESSRITPAGEWLLDNFYLIEEQIRTTKRHLPKRYGHGLPKLAKGQSTGHPRVYDIALHVIAHGDGRWDPENLSRFVSAYQQSTPLTLGELWAVPIMLRLALIENLARVGERVATGRDHRNLADAWADRMEATAESDPKSLILVTADMARSNPPLTSAFVAELARRLQGRGAALALPLGWIEQRLAESGLSLEQLVQTENQQQATNQTTVSNSIASLRRLGEMDWREFVEQMSAVHRILLDDPLGTYAQMDFATRDQYRHVVERLARCSLKSESEVAAAAVELALGTEAGEGNDMRRHVGFYLVGAGGRQLERAVVARPGLRQKIRNLARQRPVRSYIGLIGVITLASSAYLLLHAKFGLADTAARTAASLPFYPDVVCLILLGVALLLATNQLAIALVNWAATLLARPQTLPRMDYRKGIPESLPTLVVVPAMLGDEQGIDNLAEALEIRYLGNRDAALSFALLTDFNDADTESTPADERLLEIATARIAALNERYAGPVGDVFFLFHRPRLWNPGEKRWMGRERKRGKLSDLNTFLLSTLEARQAAAGRFLLIVGRTGTLTGDTGAPRIKYVITLDTDTQLPRDAARQYVAAMAHPLNRPRYDAARRRVVEGHAILQPRVAEALASAGPTRYARLFGSEPGIDPYTRTVSDVYQDLFDEGSFIGKGIYDVEVFERALGQCFPENAILSHDLLEGCYLRAGLLTDVPLYEQSPGSYLADARRRARWIRGDWQLLGWLLPQVADAHGRSSDNPLNSLSHWKLFDNLRRSLVPASLLILLGLGWSTLVNPGFWLIAVVAIIALPAGIATLLDIVNKPSEVLLRQHLRVTLRNLRRHAGQILLQITMLPFEAIYSLDAIVRTAWRMGVSRRHLLEWVPSDQAGRGFKDSTSAWIRVLWSGPAIALGMGGLLTLCRPEALPLAAPILGLWLASPWLARWLSRPVTQREARLDATQRLFLRTTARRTWAYFADFVRAEDNWLPPDNFQESPREALARRTSPTNIGMALLANLSAHDFGYLSLGQLVERTGHTLHTLGGLERYRGHFYNWYDTQTLQPLPPRYVSTVDSGNLAGHLLVLNQGLLELIDAPVFNPAYLHGLLDTTEIVHGLADEPSAALARLRAHLQTPPTAFGTLAEAAAYLQTLAQLAAEAAGRISASDENREALGAWPSRLLDHCKSLHEEIAAFSAGAALPSTISLRGLSEHADEAIAALARERIVAIESLAGIAVDLTRQEYEFLYDATSHLLTVGFNVDNRRRDRGNYDLLSSEARLGIYVAIAQGQIPQESWFALGRLLTLSNGEPILVSWSGSMFEYLMPMLVMPNYANTLLDQTCRAAVNRQIDYGKQRGVAWGVSESGYYAFDAHLNYQYRAFGVPGLGLKRGLADDLVVAPYASVMGLMVEPEAACNNMQRLVSEGAMGQYGFYEAVDHTPSRLPRGQTSALIRSYMVHHQGMSLLSLSALLHGHPMQRRFMADTQIQAALLLLQERIPKPVASYSQITQSSVAPIERDESEAAIRIFDNPNTPTPAVQLLSNSRYHLMLTQAGSGYSRWKDIAVTRWREDGTCDDWGLFGYVRDVHSGAFWSTAYQPTLGRVEGFKAVFSEAHVEFTRREHDIETQTEIGVSPEDDIELRRIRIRNRSKTRRVIEYTSYGEIVLAPQAADLAHTAFSNLFVETEILAAQHAIVATRRPRSASERPPWLCHMLTAHGDVTSATSYETDRNRFIGRNRTLASPRAMTEPGRLSNTSGAVLDPIIAIRCRIELEPGASVTLDLITGMGETRAQCLDLVEKYRDRRLSNRVFGLAWTHNQVLLRQLNASEADTQLYSQLAGSVIYSNPNRRAASNILMSNRRGQSGLWGYSISGDLPIVLLHIEDISRIELVRQLLQAHTYWRQKGLAADLVILNDEGSNYRQALQDMVIGLLPAGTAINTTDRAGGIFVRATEHMPAEDRILLHSVASVILSDKNGTLAEQLASRPVARAMPPNLIVGPAAPAGNPRQAPEAVSHDLLFFNGIGGFVPAGNEYAIHLAPEAPTPAPWVNVIANPEFGTVISESGQAYTWTRNAHEARLTPWGNDPVKDGSGELYYIRDEETGLFWSPTALPRRGSGSYDVRHGFGYSTFSHTQEDIRSELCVYVAMDAAVKFATLKITNESARKRRLSATGYVEWVLGDLRSKTAMHVVTEVNPQGAILAHNRYNTEMGDSVAFFHVTSSTLEPIARSVTGDRVEFIGRNGAYESPAALQRKRLSGRLGAGMDPCTAIQAGFELAEGQTRELVFMLGVGENRAEADGLINRFRGNLAAHEALAAVHQYWQRTLGVVQVKTPDAGLDLLANGWLLYQTLSSRMWARSGYYQSGGAFGFRDQLQDSMALVHAEPQRLRAQIVMCASRQFAEGDVQHWWHPPLGRGVRTRCSDDYLWLPFALARYLEASGDISLLDEMVPFLEGRQLNDDEESYYDLPAAGHELVSVYEHAARAIRHGLRFGEHGLPLIGSGDWNDGMNLVGEHGRGESVWLGFFLFTVLSKFSRLALAYGDAGFADHCDEESRKLQVQIETHAWDGEWYRRAYFDDGTPLGSAGNNECRIDAIAQSWAVLSGAASPERIGKAMDALHTHLVRADDGLIQLLTPPFDSGSLNPGYIKGYVPGVRENGGQYTHGAIWAAMAFAEMGDSERAWELFRIINPINHARTPAEVATYRIEPYVLAADVYGVAPHIGRGGWSWYTGSAGWMYRFITESLLGLRMEAGPQGPRLRLKPCLPADWSSFAIDYRYGKTLYRISLQRGAASMEGAAVKENIIPLADDGAVHEVTVSL